MNRGKADSKQSDKKDNRFGIAGGSVVGQDLNQLLVHRPESTFYLKMAADQSDIELFRGDILMVDRSISPRNSDLVVITDEDNFHVSRYIPKQEVWGVVTYVIHREHR